MGVQLVGAEALAFLGELQAEGQASSFPTAESREPTAHLCYCCVLTPQVTHSLTGQPVES